MKPHFHNPVQPVSPQSLDYRNNSPIRTSLSFYNNTNRTVGVLHRNGLKYKIPPDANLQANRFLIRQDYNVIDGRIREDITRLLCSDIADNPELLALKEAASYTVHLRQGNPILLTLEYPITISELERLGGTIYFSEMDIVLTLDAVEEHEHPYSVAGRKIGLLQHNPESQEGVLFQSVKVVDNTGQHGPRFIDGLGGIYRVEPIQDPSLADGIYVTTSDTDVEGGSRTKFFLFENAESEFPIYRSLDEVHLKREGSTGDKLSLRRIEYDIQQQKLAIIQQQQQNEQRSLELEKERKELDHSRALLLEKQEKDRKELEHQRALLKHEHEIEQARWKNYYDHKSHERKDQSEAVKFLPAIVTGLGALFIAAKALF